MSIRPLHHAEGTTLPSTPITREKRGVVSSRFEEFLDAARADGTIDRSEAEAAVEIARLDQMRQFLEGGSSPLVEPSFPIVQPSPVTSRHMLTNYREALPPSATVTSPSPEPVVGEQMHHPSRLRTLDDIIHEAATQNGVDERLIRAVIQVESGFRVDAVSRAGAQGLMQLMPATAKSLGVSDPFDPAQNVMAGTRFLKQLLTRYDGNMEKALAAYNWGPGNVDRHGMRLPSETRLYVARVTQLYSQQG